MNAAHLAQLMSHRIFASLNPIEAETLATAGEMLYLQDGALLFDAGDRADGFYVVLEGILEVRVEGKTLASLGAGEVVGEMGLVTADRRSAAVVAVAEGSVWHLGSAGFEALLQSGDPMATGILLGIARDMGRRFRDAVLDAAKLVPRVAATPGGPELIDQLQWGEM